MYYILTYINVKNQIHAQELLQILGEAHHTEYPAEMTSIKSAGKWWAYVLNLLCLKIQTDVENYRPLC